MKKILVILTLFTVALASCKEDPFVESTPYTIVPDGDPNYSYIKFLNMSPGSPSVNFFVNNTKISGVNNTASTVNGFGYNAYFPDFGYVALKPGSNVVDLNITGSATTDAGLNVFTGTFDMAAGKYFSIYYTGAYNATTKKIPSSLVVEDIKPALDTAKIFVRVVNLYSGGPSVDLIHAADGQKIVSNVAFNTASGFAEIPNPGQSNKYNLNISGTNTVLKDNYYTLTLTKGRAYTFIVRGISGSTTYPLLGNYYTTFIP